MIRSRSARRAPLRSRLATCALLVAVAVAAAMSASALSAAATRGDRPALVGLYRGQSDEHRAVALRISREGDAGLVLSGFRGSFEIECAGGRDAREITVDERPHARLGDSDHVEFRALGGSATVTMTIRGVLASGQVIDNSAGCRGNASFSVLFQGHDVLLEPGRYLGRTQKQADLAIGVTRARGYFEVADFTTAAEDCEGDAIQIDVSPDAIIEGDERVAFGALGGRAEVSITFLHRHYAVGQVVFSEGGCTKTTDFEANLGPAT